MVRAGRPRQGLCYCCLISQVPRSLCSRQHDSLLGWLIPPSGGRQEARGAQLQSVRGCVLACSLRLLIQQGAQPCETQIRAFPGTRTGQQPWNVLTSQAVNKR